MPTAFRVMHHKKWAATVLENYKELEENKHHK